MPSRISDDLIGCTVGSSADAQALAQRLRDDGQWREVVAGIDSVVVRFDAANVDAETAMRAIGAALESGIEPLPTRDEVVEIPVVYGGDYGPDLDALSQQTGMSADEIVEAHTNAEHVVEMIGFLPGFAFIGGLDERLRVPRRAEPRLRVPAGSIGVADGRTGIYAIASPGGWNLIGRTPERLFDPRADDPFRLRAGMRIRFVRANEDGA